MENECLQWENVKICYKVLRNTFPETSPCQRVLNVPYFMNINRFHEGGKFETKIHTKMWKWHVCNTFLYISVSKCRKFNYAIKSLFKSFWLEERLSPEKSFLVHFIANFHIFQYNVLQTCYFHIFVCIFVSNLSPL